jgi:hypothetical protein
MRFKILVGTLFSILVFTLIFNAIEPELTGALIKLEGKMICPPELTEGNFKICFSHDGEVVVDGDLEKEVTLKIEEELCSILPGKYNHVNICTFNDFWNQEKLYITGVSFLNNKTLKISKIIGYAKMGKYIQLLRIAKRIPIK